MKWNTLCKELALLILEYCQANVSSRCQPYALPVPLNRYWAYNIGCSPLFWSKQSIARQLPDSDPPEYVLSACRQWNLKWNMSDPMGNLQKEIDIMIKYGQLKQLTIRSLATRVETLNSRYLHSLLSSTLTHLDLHYKFSDLSFNIPSLPVLVCLKYGGVRTEILLNILQAAPNICHFHLHSHSEDRFLRYPFLQVLANLRSFVSFAGSFAIAQQTETMYQNELNTIWSRMQIVDLQCLSRDERVQHQRLLLFGFQSGSLHTINAPFWLFQLPFVDRSSLNSTINTEIYFPGTSAPSLRILNIINLYIISVPCDFARFTNLEHLSTSVNDHQLTILLQSICTHCLNLRHLKLYVLGLNNIHVSQLLHCVQWCKSLHHLQLLEINRSNMSGSIGQFERIWTKIIVGLLTIQTLPLKEFTFGSFNIICYQGHAIHQRLSQQFPHLSIHIDTY